MNGTHVAVDQGFLFQRLRWWLWRNTLDQMVGHSIVRPITILISSILVVAFVFAVAFGGFRFLVEVTRLPPHGQILEMLIGLLFFSLGFLLIFSGGLILHGSLFSGAETAFLLSSPVKADMVFAYKFQASLAFSSWAFLLLGGPILIAYGLVAGCPWYFYLLLPLYFFGFILLPGSVAAVLCLLIVNYVPRRRLELFALLIVILLALLGWWIYQVVLESRSGYRSAEAPTETANTFLFRISFGRSVFLPSGWVARGLLAGARGDLASAGYYLALVWSNGLMFYLVSAWLASGLYRRGFNRLATGGDLRKKHGGLWMDRLLESLLPFIDRQTRLLIIKDFRTFRRDPLQWGQVALFTGLLALYFTNIRRMFVRDMEWPYQNLISFLNLCAIAMLLSAYTGRFIYPLLSLEGRKFWVLGLLPLKRDQLLWGKFIFSTLGGLVLACGMILLSDVMLSMPLDIILLHQLTVLILSAGLSGLSVGMGALFPNFRETDPSKIAVGFGGTVNLIVGLGYLLAVLGLMSGPWHGFMASATYGERSPFMLPVVALSAGLGVVVGTMGVVIPLQLGIQALRKMEF